MSASPCGDLSSLAVARDRRADGAASCATRSACRWSNRRLLSTPITTNTKTGHKAPFLYLAGQKVCQHKLSSPCVAQSGGIKKPPQTLACSGVIVFRAESLKPLSWQPACTTNPRYGLTISLLIINRLRTSKTRKTVRILFWIQEFPRKTSVRNVARGQQLFHPRRDVSFSVRAKLRKVWSDSGDQNTANRRCSFHGQKYLQPNSEDAGRVLSACQSRESCRRRYRRYRNSPPAVAARS